VYDQKVQLDRAAQAVKAAEQRVREAEEQAEAAEARAVVEALAPDISSLRTSIETITRERLFPQRAPREYMTLVNFGVSNHYCKLPPSRYPSVEARRVPSASPRVLYAPTHGSAHEGLVGVQGSPI
jgi:hypothetical protein